MKGRVASVLVERRAALRAGRRVTRDWRNTVVRPPCAVAPPTSPAQQNTDYKDTFISQNASSNFDRRCQRLARTLRHFYVFFRTFNDQTCVICSRAVLGCLRGGGLRVGTQEVPRERRRRAQETFEGNQRRGPLREPNAVVIRSPGFGTS